MYNYGHPGSFNPAVITNKEAHIIYGNMNSETGSHQPNVLGQTEALTPFFKRKENIKEKERKRGPC